MINKSRTNKIRQRIRISQRGRQKIVLKAVVIFSAFAIAILISLSAIFNFAGINNSKADPIDIRQVTEQVFLNDMSIPEPIIIYQKKSEKNTIFIQKKKKLQE